MIKESLEFILHSFRATRETIMFGHLHESLSLKEKEKRCKKNWKEHHQNCHLFILNHLNVSKQFNSLLILGSGNLAEIPIDELAKTFKQIHLVDRIHLNSVKKKYRHISQIEFLEYDLSEIENEIYQKKLAINKIPSVLQKNNYDLVISANLITQIPKHIINFLSKKSLMSELELQQFGNEIANSHFLYLKNFNCPVLLFCDTLTYFYNKDNVIEFSELPYLPFSLPRSKKEWIWETSPKFEYSSEYTIKMKMEGFILNEN